MFNISHETGVDHNLIADPEDEPDASRVELPFDSSWEQWRLTMRANDAPYRDDEEQS